MFQETCQTNVGFRFRTDLDWNIHFPPLRQQMDDINVLQHRCLLNLRRRIRDVGDGRPAQERYMRLQKSGDTLSYQGNSEEVGCYVAGHPLSKGNCYFEVTIVETGVRGTIAVGLVPKFYRLDPPAWLAATFCSLSC
ncbi:SPRY domain-containing protein 3 [Oryzias melastigma]|uniref:SPRY domain-containing protein 3 n=1 Tax=Oryzias melastigma TaxID=30732 RepID=A0A834BRZ0_ORYME|nr:SPRY domain-containing protein 3 [Oryzias melastigma]